jgi:hypothetical protein
MPIWESEYSPTAIKYQAQLTRTALGSSNTLQASEREPPRTSRLPASTWKTPSRRSHQSHRGATDSTAPSARSGERIGTKRPGRHNRRWQSHRRGSPCQLAAARRRAPVREGCTLDRLLSLERRSALLARTGVVVDCMPQGARTLPLEASGSSSTHQAKK